MRHPHTFPTLENHNFTKRLSKSRKIIQVKDVNLNNRQKPRQTKSMWNDNDLMWSKFDQEVPIHKQYIEEIINDTMKIWFNI